MFITNTQFILEHVFNNIWDKLNKYLIDSLVFIIIGIQT
jgi:hypothetical protein